MLSYLQIENVAIIEALDLELSPGFTALTGETGAGKSILIDAINAVSGAKTSRELIRTGAESAFVAAVFTGLDPDFAASLAESGIEAPDGELQLQRRLFRDGRNQCFINGAAVTVSMLRAVAIRLVNIHGQHDAQELLRAETHVGFLDGFAQDEAARAAYTAAYDEMTRIDAELRRLSMDESYKARRLDLLNFQIGELEAADLREGETEALKKRKNVIKNAVRVTGALTRAVTALLGADDVPGAEALAEDAVRAVESAAEVVHDLRPVAESVADARETLLDAASVLEDALSQLGGDESEIDAIEERLDLLYRLSRKYGSTEAEMLAFLSGARQELETLSFSEERARALQAALEAARREAEKKAAVLTALRKKAAKALSTAVEAELRDLDMPHARFAVRIEPAPLHAMGAETVEFLISANPGEEPKPLGKIASGGELSRVMLALKTVRNVPAAATLIFDEIDTGVSGSAAGRIAVKLSDVARNNQVLCITHAAQIAAYADDQKYLYKTVENGKTFTRLRTLTPEQRARELARMTFGEHCTEVQLRSAESLLRQAAEHRAAV